jgi:hypothetical protein
MVDMEPHSRRRWSLQRGGHTGVAADRGLHAHAVPRLAPVPGAEAVDLPNVDVQVVPFSAGYYIGQSHDYTIFNFDTKTPVNIVYLESHDGGEYIDDGKRTQAYLTVWEQQHAAAFGPEQSRRMLLDILDSV